MEKESFYIRNMVQKYERQLSIARKLARYRQALHLIYNKTLEAPNTIERSILVERIAREMFEKFLFTGNDTSTVQEVQRQLIDEFGGNITFQYPPEHIEVIILRKTNNEWEEVSPRLRAKILSRAWVIILNTINETMI